MPPFDDHQMGWKRGRLYIPIRNFAGIISSAGADASQGAGAAVHAASSLAASELTAFLIGAAGDEIYHLMPIPWDWDTSKEVNYSVLFNHASTGADTPDWILHYKLFAAQDALVDVVASADATGAVTHTCSTTNDSLERTAFTALSFASNFASGDVLMGFAIECNGLGGASANEIELLGVEFEYTINALTEYQDLTS